LTMRPSAATLPCYQEPVEELAVRTTLLLAILAAAIWGVGSTPPAAWAADKAVKVEKKWKAGSTEKKDNDRWKEAPKDGVIAGPKAWAKLWKAWYGDKEAPKVDFKKEVVLVAAGSGPNIIQIEELKLSDKGDLQFKWSITERGGDGFVATILKVKREGVKTVNGKKLPKE
jgi:hypothetical protein